MSSQGYIADLEIADEHLLLSCLPVYCSPSHINTTWKNQGEATSAEVCPGYGDLFSSIWYSPICMPGCIGTAWKSEGISWAQEHAVIRRIGLGVFDPLLPTLISTCASAARNSQGHFCEIKSTLWDGVSADKHLLFTLVLARQVSSRTGTVQKCQDRL